MELQTFRANSMPEALQQVREALGPDAAVLHTREVRGSLLHWLTGTRQIEVTASATVHVPTRIHPASAEAFPAEAFPEEATEPQAGFGQATRDPDTVPPVDESPQRVEIQPDRRPHAVMDSRVSRFTSLSDLTAQEPPATGVALPSSSGGTPLAPTAAVTTPQADTGLDLDAALTEDIQGRLNQLEALVGRLVEGKQDAPGSEQEMTSATFQLFTDLLDAELDESLAHQLLDQLRSELAAEGSQLETSDAHTLRKRMVEMVEREIATTGPIAIQAGTCRLVALVGPTGVGKTTTIAKLAANFHLRDKIRVGLITVDTYRIAAVEQLRTYAEIIDLPMEVVSTPSEMQAAVQRLSHLDLILMDTAGRSPRDEVRIQELKDMLAIAEADEVHLVLSSVSSLASLKKTADQFLPVGVTSMILTKLDEATGHGNLLPLIGHSRLPVSYLTHGQNVPDDIAFARSRVLAEQILGVRWVAEGDLGDVSPHVVPQQVVPQQQMKS